MRGSGQLESRKGRSRVFSKEVNNIPLLTLLKAARVLVVRITYYISRSVTQSQEQRTRKDCPIFQKAKGYGSSFAKLPLHDSKQGPQDSKGAKQSNYLA